MSFNAKNLTYGHQSYSKAESNEPEFLRKLKGQYGGTDPARHQQPLARPRKQKNPLEEDEDDPIYVHEANPHEPMSKAAYDALMDTATEDHDGLFTTVEESSRGAKKSSDQTGPPSEPHREKCGMQEAPSKQQMAVIGAASKKRSAKIVGDGAEADDARVCAENLEPAKSQGLKKAKKQKLSFQDD
ncbi:MAG: hypothetical protein LQ343_007623 [Gyalolechia ehrenbergii]|nr:MAG: hypothetical protein LQ343_007623 [Gyalolechia ehrenbergii]